jgi:hypothetical protein
VPLIQSSPVLAQRQKPGRAGRCYIAMPKSDVSGITAFCSRLRIAPAV